MSETNTIQYERRVYYADTDVAGVVYHANYLRFFEEARTEFLRLLGFDQSTLKNEVGILILVKNIYQIDYNGAAKLDDLLTIESHVTEVTKASVKMRQSAKLKGTEQILVTAELRLICVSAESLKPVRLPVAIKEKLEL